MRTKEIETKEELMEVLSGNFMLDELKQIETACVAASKLDSCYIAANIVPLGRIKCSLEMKSEGNKFDAIIKKAGVKYVISDCNLIEFRAFLKYLVISRKAAIVGKSIFGVKTWNNCLAKAALVF